MIASMLPRSTRTVRESRSCWTTPSRMSPSTPAKWPYFCSSSASRRRWKMTWRAVAAATRPKPSGVWSYSPILLPSSSSSGARTLTLPLVRSTSTRAPSTAPGVFCVGVQQGIGEGVDQHLHADFLVTFQRLQCAHVDVHVSPPLPRPRPLRVFCSSSSASSGRFSSTCTTARVMVPRGMLRDWPSTSTSTAVSSTLSTRPVSCSPGGVDRDEATGVAPEVLRLR